MIGRQWLQSQRKRNELVLKRSNPFQLEISEAKNNDFICNIVFHGTRRLISPDCSRRMGCFVAEMWARSLLHIILGLDICHNEIDGSDDVYIVHCEGTCLG